ncbi:MAG: sulfite exporter TauE/SafE family protein [Betaproteobacteria bacterium]
MLWSVAAAILAAGLMGGLTGIGGVLMVPALTELGAVPLERAVASAMLASFVAAIPVAVIHMRRSPPPLRSLLLVCAVAVLGSIVGALTLERLPGGAVRAFIAVLAIASGLHALLRPKSERERKISNPLLTAVALVVGYGSAISGTGGPVMMIPTLLWLGMPVRPTIALSVAVQLPITASATLVNAGAGRLDLQLALTVMAVLLIGTFAGALLSTRLSSRTLTVCVAWVLIATGVWYGFTIAR